MTSTTDTPRDDAVGKATHPLEVYADSYAMMSRMGDGMVDCRSVEVDIRQNMIPVTRALTVPAEVLALQAARDIAKMTHVAWDTQLIARVQLRIMEALES